MWHTRNNQLHAVFRFKDFTEAFAFMTEVALYAEKQGHYPNWTNAYNTVEITLTTPDVGDVVTNKDRQLAKDIERIYDRFGVRSKAFA